MIDVTPSASLHGVLKYVRRNDKRIDKIIGFWPMYLHLGDLSNGVFSKERLTEVQSFFTDEWFKNGDAEGSVLVSNDDLTDAKIKTNKIVKAARSGENIRIWYSLNAEFYCFFLYLVDLLKDTNARISCICLQNDVVRIPAGCPGLGALNPEQVTPFLSAEHILTKEDIDSYSKEWNAISSQKQSLRVYCNGFLRCAPVDFYDGVIKHFIPFGEPFGCNEVIGNSYSVIRGLDYFTMLWRFVAIIRSGDYEIDEFAPKDPKRQYLADIERIRFIKNT